MKKTCHGCRALDDSDTFRPHCYLGFPLETEFNIKTGYPKNVKPLENCPKPKTYAEYVSLRNENKGDKTIQL